MTTTTLMKIKESDMLNGILYYNNYSFNSLIVCKELKKFRLQHLIPPMQVSANILYGEKVNGYEVGQITEEFIFI